MTRPSLVRLAAAALALAAMPLSVTAVTSPAPAASMPTVEATKLTNLKTRGTAEIDRRLANLNAALGKLSASGKLTAADKTALTGQVNTEISGLTALKTKLTADTDLTVARADVAGIVTDYRVYVLLLPKLRLVAAADRFADVESKLTAMEAKLTTKVAAAGSTGQDLTAMRKSLADMKAKILDAEATSTAVTTPLLALQPTDFNSNHTVLLGYRTTLKTADTDVVAARDDAKSIIAALKAK